MRPSLDKTAFIVRNAWLVGVLAAGSLPAAEVCEDFSGFGELFDCDPICWSTVGCCTATFVPSEEGIEVHPTEPRTLGLAFTGEPVAGDVRVNLNARIIGGDPRSLVACLHFDPIAFSGYFGGLRRRDSGSWSAAVAIWDDHQFIDRPEAPLDFDPTSESVEIEFRSVGGRLELRAWPTSQERPEEPQLAFDHTRFRDGVTGFGYNNWNGASHAIFERFCYAEENETFFRRGDCNDDGELGIADAVCILEWLFLGARAPGCVAATNVNGDAQIDLSDAVAVLSYLFLGGSAPQAPYPDCGRFDPAVEGFDCASTQAGCI